MKLDELHIFEGRACLVGQIATASGVYQCIGGPEVNPAITPRGKNDCLCLDANNPSFEEVEREDAKAPPLIDDQREGIPLFVDRDLKTDHLFIKSMKQVVSGPVGGITGARETGPA